MNYSCVEVELTTVKNAMNVSRQDGLTRVQLHQLRQVEQAGWFVIVDGTPDFMFPYYDVTLPSGLTIESLSHDHLTGY